VQIVPKRNVQTLVFIVGHFCSPKALCSFAGNVFIPEMWGCRFSPFDGLEMPKRKKKNATVFVYLSIYWSKITGRPRHSSSG
jgi:hypothetical protein